MTRVPGIFIAFKGVKILKLMANALSILYCYANVPMKDVLVQPCNACNTIR